jgi:beta-glucosidase
LDFYDRLVDALVERGIRPFVTLYHWDLPQAVEDAGGWPDERVAQWYADYADAVFERLGDRVKDWITLNEPWVFCYLGYGVGFHAPGRADIPSAFAAAHTALRAHGAAVQRLRARWPDARIGISLSVAPNLAASGDEKDAAAARRGDAFHHGWFLEPISGRDYPVELREAFGDAVPVMSDADLRAIAQPLDFLGLNYYTRSVVTYDAAGPLRYRSIHPPGDYTTMSWEVYPAGLLYVLRDFSKAYDLPLYVTENGAAIAREVVDARGEIDDRERLRYLQSHFEMAHRAIDEGVDLRGYFVWSLIDNFEWTFGYAQRFGLVRCDFESLVRTPKLSARWYARVIEENGV